MNRTDNKYMYIDEKAEKIPHTHLPQVAQSGFNAKVNVLTFGKLQDNFFLFSTFFSSIQ